MAAEVKRYRAAQAWVGGAWQSDVLLSVGADGHWCGVEPGAPQTARAGAVALDGAVLPGLVNAHSHAFQRAIAGLTERSGAGHDDFWSWRDRMYRAANRISPAQLEAIAALLYAELLQRGYTQVCEFHYLHRAVGGAACADPMEMSLALLRAAQRVGIGLTLLPTLYMRSGFDAAGLRAEQQRFAGTPDTVLRIAEDLGRHAQGSSPVNAGIALHSLRAVDPGALLEVDAATLQRGLPLHIHIAEQQQEVADCIKRHGQRPIEWLLDHAGVDARWNLVHATHGSGAELQGVQRSGAAVVICPSTEANLGDGLFDLSAYAGVAGNWSIGSDSHVTRSWCEELRLLEYGQRLGLRQRNIAARSCGVDSSAAALFNAALAGGPAATGLALGGIAPGQRADFLVLDSNAPALLGIAPEHRLDALVFSSPDAGFSEVYVAGRRRVAQGRVCGASTGDDLWPLLAADFSSAMQALWAKA